MRALKQIREVPSHVEGSFESLLAQFSATTLELNPSLSPPEFAHRLTTRAAEMLGAKAVVLALARGEDWEIASSYGLAQNRDGFDERRLRAVLSEKSAVSLAAEMKPERLPAEAAQAIGWCDLLLARLVGSDKALLGVLCLGDIGRELSAIECQLLEALAAHAAVALENARLFAKVEWSRKQWVEDVDAISDLIVVHDHANRILRANRTLADLLCTRPNEVIGREIGRLELLSTPPQSHSCPFCRNLDAEIEEFIHPAGDRTYLVSTSRIHSGADEGQRTVHVLKDITDRREAERRYRRERDFNRNILNNTQSMILVLDTAGLISYANRRCFEVGYAEKDLLGRPLVEIVAPARRPMLVEALDRTLRGEPLENLEIPVVRAKGGSGQFSISLSPMRDEHGAINSIVVVMTDVTDAADLQAKLMHTEKMAALGQLVSGVAHEVNNPLAAIVGFTDLLLENPETSPRAKGDLKVILQEAQRTRVIVQNLLSFARHVPAQREPVQVNAVVRQTLKLRTYDFSSHGVEIVERYDDDLPVIVGDPHQLQQVMLNILNNAYDATQEVPRPGRIEVVTSRRDDEIEIAFRDNGSGIQHPEKIFDPFFTTKEVGKGTGLGLSICYGIVRAHRGEIVARNNEDGVGCTFAVRLPIALKQIELTAL
jgi:PAS domain S-box-containing protein